MKASKNLWNWIWQILTFHIFQVNCPSSALFSTALWLFSESSHVIVQAPREWWIPVLQAYSLTSQMWKGMITVSKRKAIDELAIQLPALLKSSFISRLLFGFWCLSPLLLFCYCFINVRLNLSNTLFYLFIPKNTLYANFIIITHRVFFISPKTV